MKSSFSVWLSLMLLNTGALAQQGWIERDTFIGLTNTLYDVVMIDSQRAFAAGEWGAILKTTDSGLNWSVLTSGTTMKLNALCFVDSLTGWAVGNELTVLKTTDGGLNWSSKLSPMSYRHCYDVCFIDADTGWTVCRDNFTGYIALVYKTTNGGTSWQSIQTGTSANLYSLFFINSSVGWAVGSYGSILKSENGGINWSGQKSSTSEALYSVCFIDSETGWIAGAHGVVLSTTDGGVNWIKRQTGTLDNLKSITFINASVGWTTGANGTILKTVDGGISWAMQQSGTGNELNSVCFIDETIGMAVGQNCIILATGDGGGVTFKPTTLVSPGNSSSMNAVNPTMAWNPAAEASSYRLQIATDPLFSNTLVDQSGVAETSYNVSGLAENTTYYWHVSVNYPQGNGNWSEIWNFVTSGLSWHAQASNTTYDINSVFFVDPNTAWAVGGNPAVLKTTDGGVHWEPQKSPQNWGAFYSVFFVNSSVGWILGNQGSVYKTIDGGLTWINQSWNFNGHIYNSHFADSLTGWAASDLGIFHTTDGGTSWNEINPDTEYGFWLSVFFTDSLTGWIGNVQGEICNTTDGGVTWIKQKWVTREDINSIFFIDTQTGWVAGDNGLIMKTTGGGENWTILNSGTDQSLNYVRFIDDQTGWIAGDNGLILKTVDGGEHWAVQVSKTAKNLKCMHFNDTQTGWITGEAGMILKTTDGGGIMLAPPGLLNPPDRITGLETDPELSWNATSGAVSYHVQVCEYPLFHTSVTDISPVTGTSANLSGLSDNSVYYWRVRATYPEGVSNWSEIRGFATAGGEGWEAQFSGIYSQLQSVYFINEQTGWIIGYDGELLGTEDGGTNWSILAYVPISFPNRIFFIDESTGWTIGYSKIYKTTDGGSNWIMAADLSAYSAYSFHFIDELNGWAAGNGYILKTSDGGTNWDVQKSGLTENLRSIFFIDSQTGWAVGNNGSVLKTINGGVEWIPQQSGITESLSSVRFVNDSTGWTCSNYSIYRSTNGGTTWDYYDDGSDYWLASYYFLNDSTGWAAGYKKIQGTTDGGVTWSGQSTLNDYSYYSIFFINDTTGYAVGDNGIILKTTSGGLLPGTDVAKPNLVSPLNSSHQQPTTLTFTWSPVKNAESYTLMIDDNSNFSFPKYIRSGISGTSQEVSGLQCCYTTYYWKVGVSGKSGPVVWSDAWWFSTAEELPLVQLLSPVEDSSMTTNSIYFTWQLINMPVWWISNYQFELATDSLMNDFVLVDSLLEYYHDHKIVDNLDFGQTYWWRVKAKRNNSWGPFSEQRIFSIAPIPPDTSVQSPVLLSPENHSVDQSTTLNFNWEPAQYAVSYTLMLDHFDHFPDPEYIQSGITETYHEVTGLECCNAFYYWRVKASGSSGDYAWSDIWSFSTADAGELPTILLISPADGEIIVADQIFFYWDASNMPTDAIDKYQFDLATDSLMTNLLVSDSMYLWNFYFINNLNNEQNYWWQVRANKNGNWGPFSEIFSFRIEMITPGTSGEISMKFKLGKNFPDPFSNSTTIEYTLPVSVHVELKVYDLMGTEVQTLVDCSQAADHYKVYFNAQDLPAGVYFYKLRAGEYVETKKMIIF